MCWIVFAGFILVLLCLFSLLRGTSIASTPPATVLSDCCAFSPGLQSQWLAITVNCNGLSTGKMFLSTKGLGDGGRFTHVDWAAGS